MYTISKLPVHVTEFSNSDCFYCHFDVLRWLVKELSTCWSEICIVQTIIIFKCTLHECAIAINLFSEYKPSDDELDPMDPAAYSDTPRSVSHMNTSSTSLRISWLPHPVEDQNGIIIAYNITCITARGSEMIDSTSGSVQFIALTGLLKFSTYNISVASIY